MAVGGASSVTSDSIIFYLDAGNTKSKMPGDIYWKDLSRNQYGFTVSNFTFYDSPVPSIKFAGLSNSYVRSMQTIGLSYSSITYNMWIKASILQTDQLFFSDDGQSHTAGHIWFAVDNSTTMQLDFGYAKGDTFSYGNIGHNNFFSPEFQNEWINLTYIVDYSALLPIEVYRNGYLFATTSFYEAPNYLPTASVIPVPPPRSGQYKIIGSYNTAYANPFSGNISIVQIYSRRLSASEVLKNYNALQSRHSKTENISTNGLQLHLDPGDAKSYPGTGTIWTDISPNGYTFGLSNTLYNVVNKGRIRFLAGTGSRAESATAFPLYSQTSYSFWADCGTSSQNLTFLSDSGQSATQGFVWIYKKSLSDDLILEYSDGVSVCGLTASNFFSGYGINKWVNINATVDYSGASASIYRDDSLYATFSMSGTPQIPISLVKYIGSYSTASVIPTGDLYRIGAVAIYNRLISAVDVSSNYSALRGRYGK